MNATYDEPGSAGYSPPNSEADGVVFYSTRSTQPTPANAVSGDTSIIAQVPQPPSPSVGGEARQNGALGWSTGFGFFRRFRGGFTGRTLVVPSMGLHPADGPVGFSTRSQRLRNRVQALTNDYTPTRQEAVQEVVNNV